METNAEFSDCRQYRYWLSRIWDETKPKAMCIGLNPSTANEQDTDTTITNLCKLLGELGYGGFYMTNVFALVSTDPDAIQSCSDPLRDNDLYLQAVRRHCKDVFFCWGAFKQVDYRVGKLKSMFPDALCFGKTEKGKPLHPLAATIWRKKDFKVQKF